MSKTLLFECIVVVM